MSSLLLLCTGVSSSQISAQEDETHKPKLLVVGVKPNELGVKRIQKHQEEKNLHPATLEIAFPNEELIFTVEGKEDAVKVENDPEALDLPNFVDNRFQTAAPPKSMEQPVAITGLGPDRQDLRLIKQLLNNGHSLFFMTDLSSWVLSDIKANPETDNAPYVGELAVSHQTGSQAKDIVHILGYHDGIWIDINENNSVDEGEKGAFLVEGLEDGRYIWVAYDAFLSESIVGHDPKANRTPIANGTDSFAVILVPFGTVYQPQDSSETPAQEQATVDKLELYDNTQLNEIASKAISSLFKPIKIVPTAEPTLLPAEPIALPETRSDKPAKEQGNHSEAPAPIPTSPIITAPLALTILSPVAGARVQDSVLFSVTAVGGTPIKEVTFYVDGKLTSTLTNPPFQIMINTSSWKRGKHTLSATATNVDDEQVSKSIEVTRKKKHH